MSTKTTAAAHRPRIKKGDQVVVITGTDKGKTGRVLAVYPRENRVLVEGVRVAKRAYRKGANPDLPQGGIHEKEMPIHLSNVMLAHPKTGAPTRMGVRYDTTGKDDRSVRVRVAKGRRGENEAVDLKD
jgi:large subunit ribosomal protein L24